MFDETTFEIIKADSVVLTGFAILNGADYSPYMGNDAAHPKPYSAFNFKLRKIDPLKE